MKSVLFVPADRPQLFSKAAQGDASVVCLDLEDGVAPDLKPTARQNLPDAVAELRQANKCIALRINSDLEHISLDLACVAEGVEILVVPKSGSARMLQDLEDALRRTQTREILLLPLIEGAADLAGLEMDARLPASVMGICLGTEDYAADLGVSSSSEAVVTAFHRLAVLAARHKVSLFGYPGSIAEFKDLDLFASWAKAGKAGGAIGGFAIHPKQVEVLNNSKHPA